MTPLKNVLGFSLFGCISIALFALLYILHSADGDTWVDGTLVWGRRAWLMICLCAFGLAAINKSKGLIIGTFGIVGLSSVASALGGMDCVMGGLSGGYHRTTNCGQEINIYSGLMVYALIVVMIRKSALLLLMMSSLVVSVGYLATYHYLSKPLERIVAEADLTIECFIRQPNYYAHPFDTATATRIRSIEDLQFGNVIGEQSPRIYRVTATEAHVWKFSELNFVSTRRKGLKQFCFGGANSQP
ncbi:MAG: hypothetical protein ABJ251_03410 [Paracoccaceae bacterium]